MKTKLYLLVAVITIVCSATFAQNDVRASMGIELVSCTSIRDYLNKNIATSSQQIAAFNTAISFGGEYGYQLKPDMQLGVEYQYLLNSFNLDYFLGGNYELSYNVQSVSAMAYYVIPGQGYKIKIGGGLGPRFSSLEEKYPSYSETYTSTGFGILAKADGSTTLGGNLYAYIGGDLRLDINGSLKRNGENFKNKINNENVNLNSISAGLKLGVVYLF